MFSKLSRLFRKELPLASMTSVTAAPSSMRDNNAVSSDVPIRKPDQDVYGIDVFAKAMARSIANANAAEGLVFAIYGPWGSGKSSACNLVLHHLHDQIDAKSLVPITFNPWWFSGAEALTISFFQELSVPIGKSVSEQAKNALASIGRRVSSIGPLLEPVTTALGAPGAATILSAGAQVASKIETSGTVEEEHEKLAEALRTQSKKFLVIIDDIDRLGTDEALQIFRLVKSVGRLPNVIYLLAFDRHLAEKMISERFPSEGASYLDKFIQGGFDLPMPDIHDLRTGVLRVVDDVMGDMDDKQITRFFNLFNDVCAPLIRLPRDAVRLSNAIRVTWPAIGTDVDHADFLALESLRLFLPSVHKAIRSHPKMLCGTADRNNGDRNQEMERYENTFLVGLTGRDRQIGQRAIQRLFPRTDYVWGNTFHADRASWRTDRLACSEQHFPTYFGFSVDEDAVTAHEFAELLCVANNPNEVAALLRQAASRSRRRGGTRAALLLEEIQARAQDIPEPQVQPLVTGLFIAADDIDVAADDPRAFGLGDNQMRLHWILNNLLTERFDQTRRNQIILAACPTAAIGWLIDLSRRCTRQHQPADPGQGEQQEPIVDRDTSIRIQEMAVEQLRQAAGDGRLARHRDIRWLLLYWGDITDVAEVRRWTDEKLDDAIFVANFAERSIQHSWSRGLGLFGLGDTVASKREYVKLVPYEQVVDIPRFRERVQQLLEQADLLDELRQSLKRYVATPEGDPERD